MIPAVVLAAGLSTRMGGRPKALLDLADGRTFLHTIADTFVAAGIEDIIVVIGHDADAVREHVGRQGLRVRLVMNPAYRQGQFTSVLCGVDAVDRPGVSAMLLTLVDVPLVTADTVRAVVERFRQSAAPIVRPVRGADHGHPVLIARALFGALRHADPAQGAKAVVRAHASSAGDVAVNDAAAFRDVDTPDALARLIAAPHDV